MVKLAKLAFRLTVSTTRLVPSSQLLRSDQPACLADGWRDMDWIPQVSLLYGTAFSLASIALTSGRYQLDWLYILFWVWLTPMLTAVGIATMFIGLAIMVPRVGHATWRAYRVVFQKLAELVRVQYGQCGGRTSLDIRILRARGPSGATETDASHWFRLLAPPDQ